MTQEHSNGDGPISVATVKQRWRVVLGWALVIAGVVLLALGWVGVSGEPDVARQLSYLASGGLGGLTAAILGVGFLISEDLRSERSRLGRIESTLLDLNDRVLANGQSQRKTRTTKTTGPRSR